MLYHQLSLLSIAVSAAAQSSIVPLFLLNADQQNLVASVISVSASTTEYLVGCPPGTDANRCGFNPPVTAKRAGSVYGYSLTAPQESFTISNECTVYTTSGTSAVCTASVGGAAANDAGVNTATVSGSDVAFLPVTVTAGLEKITASAAAATSASQAPSTTHATTILSGSRTASGSAAAAAATTTSKAGAAGLGVGAGLGMIAGGLAGGLMML